MVDAPVKEKVQKFRRAKAVSHRPSIPVKPLPDGLKQLPGKKVNVAVNYPVQGRRYAMAFRVVQPGQGHISAKVSRVTGLFIQQESPLKLSPGEPSMRTMTTIIPMETSRESVVPVMVPFRQKFISSSVAAHGMGPSFS
jgi:hypothetical protein